MPSFRSAPARAPGFTIASAAIALQGDHGSISFRNIKLRPLADLSAEP